MKKRGSHIGFVLSFVIFVTFLIFLYSALFPKFNEKKTKENILNNIFKRLPEKIYSNLTTQTIKINQVDNTRCFFIEKSFEGGVVIKNQTKEKIINSSVQENKIYFKDIDDSELLWIFYSDSFEEINKNFRGCEDLSYENRTIKEDKLPSIKRILELFQEYENNYSKLKGKLLIPENIDFEILFKYENGTLINASRTKRGENVYGKINNIVYFDETANFKTGKIGVIIW